MGAFRDELRRRSRAFLTNWTDSDLPLAERLVVFARNRTVATLKGCCGNDGAPGC